MDCDPDEERLDGGAPDARPLPPPDWLIPMDEDVWAEDNRRMNALLGGRPESPPAGQI